MTATQPVDNTRTAGSRRIPLRARVVCKHGNARVSIGVQSVHGCAELTKLSRVPGSHKRVIGVLLFRGEPVPLVSLLVARSGRGVSRSKHDEYALVLSVEGMRFAIRVDDVPKIVEGPSSLELRGGRTCYISSRHLGKFLRGCVVRDKSGKTASGDGGADTGISLKTGKDHT